MAGIYIVADTRESYVIPFIQPLATRAGVPLVVGQINTGDYLICQRCGDEEPQILACIERKSLKDFAASFKDGRYGNRHKMMNIRARTGCQLYFFVEGPAFPAPSRHFSRVPYPSILAAETNLMVRDGICVVKTQNEAHTAQRLIEFHYAYTRTPVPFRHGPETAAAAIPPDVVGGQTAVSDIPVGLTGRIEKSDGLLRAEIWSRLPQISLVAGQVLADTFTVADLVSGRVAPMTVRDLKSPSGRSLGSRAVRALLDVRGGDAKLAIRLLSGVPGISPGIAREILGTRALGAILTYGPAALAMVQITQKSRQVRLGGARAGRIIRLLCGPGLPPASDPVGDGGPGPAQPTPMMPAGRTWGAPGQAGGSVADGIVPPGIVPPSGGAVAAADPADGAAPVQPDAAGGAAGVFDGVEYAGPLIGCIDPVAAMSAWLAGGGVGGL